MSSKKVTQENSNTDTIFLVRTNSLYYNFENFIPNTFQKETQIIS